MATSDVASLISRVALRDRAAFAALYSATAPKLFAVCLRILKDRSDAEDALQEIFVKIWHRADHFAGARENPDGWLCAIARNHAIDRLRARRPIAERVDDVAANLRDDGLDPEQATLLKGEGRQIDRCMQELESDKASAIRAAYIDGLTYQELADRHSVPLNTMRTWLRRSLLKLRECLGR